MHFKKIILGSIFLIFSGILYEIDKALNYYKWASYIIAINGNGGYNSQPDGISFFDNKIALLFFVIGILFYLHALLSFYKEKN